MLYIGIKQEHAMITPLVTMEAITPKRKEKDGHIFENPWPSQEMGSDKPKALGGLGWGGGVGGSASLGPRSLGHEAGTWNHESLAIHGSLIDNDTKWGARPNY